MSKNNATLNEDKDEETKHPSASVLREICQQEYTTQREAYNKLYDRINITLAFYGVLFLGYIRLFDFSFILKMKTSSGSDVICIFLYMIFTILALVFFFIGFFLTLKLLQGEKIVVLNSLDHIKKDMSFLPPEITELVFAVEYAQMCAENREIFENKQTKFNATIKYIVLSMIPFVCAYIMENNFLLMF